MHTLSRRDARRIAVRAQLLTRDRPRTVLEVVRKLTLLQYDQTAAVAPSADLVLGSRLGAAFDPGDLARALDDGTLIELRGLIRPREDLALFRAEMAGWTTRTGLRDWEQDQREWVAANDDCRRDILYRLATEGPLPASALPDTTNVRWGSSGWNDNRNLQILLGFMEVRGEIAVAGRDGRDRLWDLAERIHPDDEPVPEAEALRIRAERRLASLGLARAKAGETQSEPAHVGDAGEPAVIDGVRGRWRVDPALLDAPFTGRAALLSPLDRLVFDRRRMKDIFDFDYTLEMYKPAAQRRWGYYALPILYGDALVGKLDATADRKAGVLRVDAIHQDIPFSKAATAAVHREIHDLATWLNLDLDLPSR